MKRTIVQAQCDVCGKPCLGDEVMVRRSAGRAKTFDLCPRHFRALAKALKISTTEEGKITSLMEMQARERGRTSEPEPEPEPERDEIDDEIDFEDGRDA